MNPQIRRILSAVVLSRLMFALLALRLEGVSGFFSNDSSGFVGLAKSLWHGSFSIHRIPELHTTPGYPILLMPAAFFDHVVILGIATNLILAGVCAWLVWLISSDLAPGTSAAYWAVAFYCVEPVGFLLSEKLLAETLLTAQLLAFAWLLLRFFKQPGWGKLTVAAALLGLCAYTKPITLYLVAVLFIILLFLPGDLPARRRAAGALLFTAVVAATLTPWIVRNEFVFEYPGFSSSGAYNLYAESAAAAEARSEGRSMDDVKRELLQNAQEHGPSPAKVFAYMQSEGRRIVLQHLPTYALIHARGCMIVLADPYATQLMKRLNLYPESGGLLRGIADKGMLRSIGTMMVEYPIAVPLLVLMSLQVVAYYVLAAAGLSRFSRDAAILFAAIAAYFILVSGFPGAEGRFRAPIMPLVCISAGIYWSQRKAGAESLRLAQLRARDEEYNTLLPPVSTQEIPASEIARRR